MIKHFISLKYRMTKISQINVITTRKMLIFETRMYITIQNTTKL